MIWPTLNWEFILRESGVDDPKGCMQWAFGDLYGSMMVEGSNKVWNERHGDIFTLLGSDDIGESIERIGKAYLERQESKTA